MIMFGIKLKEVVSKSYGPPCIAHSFPEIYHFLHLKVGEVRKPNLLPVIFLKSDKPARTPAQIICTNVYCRL